MSTLALNEDVRAGRRPATSVLAKLDDGPILDASSDKFGSPQRLFGRLWDEYGPFSLDPCANPRRHLHVQLHMESISPPEDGLKVGWEGRRVFVNPPYTDIDPWVHKALVSVENKPISTCIVMLVPNKTDSKWFNLAARHAQHIRFITGRLKYAGGASSARFGTMVIVFDKRLSDMWSVWELSPADRGYKGKK